MAYALPAGAPGVLKNNKMCRSFDETVIWLIEVIVLDDGGISMPLDRSIHFTS
ncbi:MAG: hypothetical protein GY847_27215 [Proteobacteria bacterium]|nr:hypothetical protein [Pseudomonadota bacterium]